jgi:hypothetical protein
MVTVMTSNNSTTTIARNFMNKFLIERTFLLNFNLTEGSQYYEPLLEYKFVEMSLTENDINIGGIFGYRALLKSSEVYKDVEKTMVTTAQNVAAGWKKPPDFLYDENADHNFTSMDELANEVNQVTEANETLILENVTNCFLEGQKLFNLLTDLKVLHDNGGLTIGSQIYRTEMKKNPILEELLKTGIPPDVILELKTRAIKELSSKVNKNTEPGVLEALIHDRLVKNVHTVDDLLQKIDWSIYEIISSRLLVSIGFLLTGIDSSNPQGVTNSLEMMNYQEKLLDVFSNRNNFIRLMELVPSAFYIKSDQPQNPEKFLHPILTVKSTNKQKKLTLVWQSVYNTEEVYNKLVRDKNIDSPQLEMVGINQKVKKNPTQKETNELIQSRNVKVLSDYFGQTRGTNPINVALSNNMVDLFKSYLHTLKNLILIYGVINASTSNIAYVRLWGSFQKLPVNLNALITNGDIIEHPYKLQAVVCAISSYQKVINNNVVTLAQSYVDQSNKIKKISGESEKITKGKK